MWHEYSLGSFSPEASFCLLPDNNVFDTKEHLKRYKTIIGKN